MHAPHPRKGPRAHVCAHAPSPTSSIYLRVARSITPSPVSSIYSPIARSLTRALPMPPSPLYSPVARSLTPTPPCGALEGGGFKKWQIATKHQISPLRKVPLWQHCPCVRECKFDVPFTEGKFARRAQHPKKCSGHLSQCFAPKHHSSSPRTLSTSTLYDCWQSNIFPFFRPTNGTITSTLSL